MLFRFAHRIMCATTLAAGVVLPSYADDEDVRSGGDATPALKQELADFMEGQGYAVVPASVVEDRAPGEQIGGQQMLVEARVCGDSKCSTRSLLTDTGSATVLLSRSAIEELDLREAGVPPIQSEEVGVDQEFLVREICVQDRCVQNSRATTFPSDAGTEVLGGLVFQKLGAIIDTENGMIYLPPAESFTLQSLDDWMLARESSYESVPLQEIGRYIVMPTQINDAGFRQFLFDTGASVSSIDSSYVDSLGLAIQEDDCESGVAETGEISVCPLRASEVRRMQVGRVPSSFVPAPVFAINLGFVLAGYDIQGVVGFDWMQGNKVIIDYESGQLWIDTAE